MAQVKIYSLKSSLDPIKSQLSDTIHSCVIDAFHYPADKRFHRFFPLDAADFYFPNDRSDRYTIVEISIFEGRSTEAKKHLIRLLFDRLQLLGISPQDLEITIFETPKQNWGFRGSPGDEHQLTYRLDV